MSTATLNAQCRATVEASVPVRSRTGAKRMPPQKTTVSAATIASGNSGAEASGVRERPIEHEAEVARLKAHAPRPKQRDADEQRSGEHEGPASTGEPRARPEERAHDVAPEHQSGRIENSGGEARSVSMVVVQVHSISQFWGEGCRSRALPSPQHGHGDTPGSARAGVTGRLILPTMTPAANAQIIMSIQTRTASGSGGRLRILTGIGRPT